MQSMIVRRALLLSILLFGAVQSSSALSLAEEFKRVGYVEICDQNHGVATFEALYAAFDEFILFLQEHPAWAQKLYGAKERFIRSKARNYYATDFFGFYDESKRAGRSQISFYYAAHFHEFIFDRSPEFKQVPAIVRFLELCREIQQPYGRIFEEAVAELGLTTLFAASDNEPPILLKIVKYFPGYAVTRPHYDGTAFSLFLDSTDNASLLLAPYAASYTGLSRRSDTKADAFVAPTRNFVRAPGQNSILLIPGSLLTELSIYPTPHIVLPSGKTRYATIAFAMRPHYIPPKHDLSPLPDFKD